MVASLYGKGYIGVGDYSYSKDKKSYDVWCGMFIRCYSEAYQKNQPTYVKCSVSSVWYDFQTFTKWFYEHHFKGSYLDKDILKQGNTVYGPDNCLFVTRKVNNLILNNKARRGKCRLGVSVCGMTGKYKAEYTNSEGKSEYLGLFDTDIEAHEAYKKAKYTLIKKVALQQTNEKIKNGLMRWIIPEY